MKEGQSTIRTFVSCPIVKYNAADPKQKQGLDSLIMFVAGDLLPLSIVESKHFLKLTHDLDPKFQVPSRKHLSTKLLQEKAREIQSLLKEQLNNAEHICLTVDLWSNISMKGFLGITAHFILGWELKSAMIACKRFKGRHTSDNATNMVKAFNFGVPGFASSVVKDNEVELFTDSDVEDTGDEEEHPFPSHKRCYAHCLQLVIKDAFDKSDNSLRKIIVKVSKLVSHVRKSIHASELLEEEKRVQASNATRWNSQLHMIQSVLNIPEQKMEKIDCPGISSYDRKVLLEVTKILKPFENATLLLQREKSVSGRMTISITFGL